MGRGGDGWVGGGKAALLALVSYGGSGNAASIAKGKGRIVKEVVRKT